MRRPLLQRAWGVRSLTQGKIGLEVQGETTKEKITTKMTFGCDLGDRKSYICALDGNGEVVKRCSISTTKSGFAKMFGSHVATTIVIEAGAHSPWVSALLERMGHTAVVANPRKVRLISHSQSKSDRADAELLARLARVDTKLLSPIQHRSAGASEDLAMVRARGELIETRTKLVNHVRGSMKSQGDRLPSCTAESFANKVKELLPEVMKPALEPTLRVLEVVTAQIKELDKQIDKELPKRYPKVIALRQVNGVGPLTALTFMLTLGDPTRFRKSRQVGAYLGLRPGRSQSGKADPELRITKAGDRYLRSLLVNCTQYILGPFGKESDLRRWGLELAARGSKNAKKRAVVAVARRLAVLLHRLWVTGEVYEPLNYGRKKQAA